MKENKQLEYNKKYVANNRRKVNDYSMEYQKKNYIRHEVKLKKDEEELLQNVLKDKGLTLKKYLLYKLKEDLK